jgi:radical SAM enzyme (TIGR01210 family)
MDVCNPVLKSIMKHIHANRCHLAVDPKTVVRHEISDGKPMCEIWFMTEGCAYDREGGCTMCNYGKGHTVNDEVILSQLQVAFSSMPKTNYNLVVNPSGSFLDEREVSEKLRQSIYHLLDDVPFESLTVESRADVLQYAILVELRKIYPQKHVSVEIGVETMDSWLLKNSVNKGITTGQISEAINMIRKAELSSVANIGIGLPFINERTNIITAAFSVIKAFEVGFDTVILFPYHVKPGTLLETLYTTEAYHCISLWGLVDVLSAIPAHLLPNVNISWYRNYYTDKSKIIASPDTCPDCRETILDLLDKYKSTPSLSTLSAINNINCRCHTQREKWLNTQEEGIDFISIERLYRSLASLFGVDSFVLENTLKEMRETLYVDN